MVSNARSLTVLHFLSPPSRQAFSRGRKAFPETARLRLKNWWGRKRGVAVHPEASSLGWYRLESGGGGCLSPAGSLRGAGSVGCAEGRRRILGLACKTVSGVHANSGPNSSILNQSPWLFWAGGHGCHPPHFCCAGPQSTDNLCQRNVWRHKVSMSLTVSKAAYVTTDSEG